MSEAESVKFNAPEYKISLGGLSYSANYLFVVKVASILR